MYFKSIKLFFLTISTYFFSCTKQCRNDLLQLGKMLKNYIFRVNVANAKRLFRAIKCQDLLKTDFCFQMYYTCESLGGNRGASVYRKNILLESEFMAISNKWSLKLNTESSSHQFENIYFAAKWKINWLNCSNNFGSFLNIFEIVTLSQSLNRENSLRKMGSFRSQRINGTRLNNW
jgi:hypothetical protein